MNFVNIVLTGDTRTGETVCGLLSERQLHVAWLHQAGDLEEYLLGNSCRLLLIDLDTISVDKTVFRKLKKNHPGIDIIVLSSRSFHPELKEALSTHIYACLDKPIDEDELMFCITSLL
ncbi:MAG: response regulator [Thermodesulfobacteriota bacterium]